MLAFDALQLKECLQEKGQHLLWLSSDWNLADALTKLKAEARRGYETYLKTGMWRLKYDPEFVVAAKKMKRKAKTIIEEEFGEKEDLRDFREAAEREEAFMTILELMTKKA